MAVAARTRAKLDAVVQEMRALGEGGIHSNGSCGSSGSSGCGGVGAVYVGVVMDLCDLESCRRGLLEAVR